MARSKYFSGETEVTFPYGMDKRCSPPPSASRVSASTASSASSVKQPMAVCSRSSAALTSSPILSLHKLRRALHERNSRFLRVLVRRKPRCWQLPTCGGRVMTHPEASGQNNTRRQTGDGLLSRILQRNIHDSICIAQGSHHRFKRWWPF